MLAPTYSQAPHPSHPQQQQQQQPHHQQQPTPNTNLPAPRPYYHNYPPAPNASYLPPSSSPPPSWSSSSTASALAVPPSMPSSQPLYGNVNGNQNAITATPQTHPNFPQGYRYPSNAPQVHVPPSLSGPMMPALSPQPQPTAPYQQQHRYAGGPQQSQQTQQQQTTQSYTQKLPSMSSMYPPYGGDANGNNGSGVMMSVVPSGFTTGAHSYVNVNGTNAPQQQSNPATRMPIMQQQQQHPSMNAPYPYYDSSMPPPMGMNMNMNMNMNMGMVGPMAPPYSYPVDYMGFSHMMPQGGPFSPFTSRVSCACSNCKKAKTRCDSARPCGRCKRLGREHSCVDSVHQRRGRSVQTNSSLSTNQRKRTSRDDEEYEEEEEHEEDEEGNNLSAAEEEEEVQHNPAKGPNKVRVTAGGHESERASPSVAPVPAASPPIAAPPSIPTPVDKSPLSFADQANRQAMENSETTTFRANVALPGSGSASSLSLLSYLSSPSSSFTPTSFPSTPAAYNATLVNKGIGEHSGNSTSQLTPTLSATNFRGDFATVTQSAPVSKRRLVSPACLQSNSTQTQSPTHASSPAASTRLKSPQSLRASGSDVTVPDTSSLAYDRAMKAQTSLVSQSEPTLTTTVVMQQTVLATQTQQSSAPVDNPTATESLTSRSTPTPSSSASPTCDRSTYSSSASSTSSTASFSASTRSSTESVPALASLDVNSKSDSDGGVARTPASGGASQC